MMGCWIPRSFNKKSLVIYSIFVLAATGLLAAEDTSATLSGQINGPATDVQLTLQAPPRTIFSVRKDDQGRFKFSVLPGGTYVLEVGYLGFKYFKVKSIQVASGQQKVLPPLRMDVAPSDTFLPNPEFDPHRGDQPFGNLSGRVLGHNSRALALATVKLICDEKICGETKTNSNGEFIFFNLSPRDDYTILVTRSGYYEWQAGDYEIQAGYDATYGSIMLRPRTKLARAASTVR